VSVWAPVGYTGPARALVHALKFRGARAVAALMAAQIAANAPDCFLAGALVPVPLHARRLRARGFNQAALVATALAERTGLPVCDCLARAGSARTQMGRRRGERRAGLTGEIGLRAPAPERVLLVDDVVTTGATLAACAAAIRAARAPGRSVDVAAVSFARTLGR
jgi:ComF family protein